MRVSTRGKGRAGLERAIADRLDFQTGGSLRGVSGTYQSTGSLPSGWRDRIERENPCFVIYSYATPIAWFSTEHGWTVPDVKYSVTTSRQQGLVSYIIQRS